MIEEDISASLTPKTGGSAALDKCLSRCLPVFTLWQLSHIFPH